MYIKDDESCNITLVLCDVVIRAKIQQNNILTSEKVR